MDVGTVLDGEDAVRNGLIDRLGGLSDALDFLNEIIEEKAKNENKKENINAVDNH